MLGGLLKHLPVRAVTLQMVTAQLERCQRRVATLKALLAKTRAGLQQSKAKADDAQRRAAAAREEIRQHATHLRQQSKQIERLKADLVRAQDDHARDRQVMLARIADLRERPPREAAKLRSTLVSTARDVALARDQLTLIDAKLDILEGAANVLDGRTRAIDATRHRASESHPPASAVEEAGSSNDVAAARPE